MKKISSLLKKYQEIINYIIVGGLTTLVSLGSYYFCVKTFLNPNNGWQLQFANIISWILAVTFAYFANRIFVFKSKNKKVPEALGFFLARILTLLIDMLVMFLLVTLIKMNDKLAKILVQFVILVSNYILSKYIIFNKHKDKKIMFISSTGGHFNEMSQLKELTNKYEYYLVTEKTPDKMYLKDKYPGKVSYLVYGTKDHFWIYPFKLLYNSFKSLFIYFKFRPAVIITTGAHTAGPMCCIGKIFGSKIIFIESMANITTKTITGRIVYHFADMFIVQWESMLKFYPKAKYGGWIF